ncbi:hypothetical protein [Marinobacter zhanjiangensis]|uniref:Right handed beta helix region n=1 Tax=Marinobacter zhanjiangensis TaxID=578215 RepID=A0ABQ3B9W7_9GAMM|nr:hypothetical protein [Marinobacter zhanjiangensis]GGY80228.1 hypothetical protein GCM10007071_29440 [Marinobacter zhanjiangensis]
MQIAFVLVKALKRFGICATVVMLLVSSPVAFGATPHLAFSDLISGPGTGLGDGKGSGVIVTVWGQNLGVNKADRKLIFEDSQGELHEPYIYYWKAADGSVPSGPVNLYESHKMHEIAFSIPDASLGDGEIYVQVEGESSASLIFTVREGSIYHVKNDGNDADDGSFSGPWKTVDKAVNSSPAGSTIYIHDVDTGSRNSEAGIYWNSSSASSDLNNQFTITSYPGFHPKVTAQRGFEAYRAAGAVLSKLDIYSSDFTSVDENGQPTGGRIQHQGTWGIKASRNGRAVANRIGDIPGMCASRYQGAIVGAGGSRVSNFKILGNEVYDYGCEGSSKLHHTTYMSIRSGPDNVQVDPWEFGYNYLHGNKAKFGIHNFDQDEGCGGTTGPVLIHNNVVVDQGGAGISIGASAGCKWDMDFYVENNVLVNVGLAADWDGVDPNTSDGSEPGGIAIRDSGLMGTIYVRNNLIYGWSTDGLTRGATGCLAFNGAGDNVSVIWDNNICVATVDVPFFATGYRAENKEDNVSGSYNVWHSEIAESKSAPAWDANPFLFDPMLEVMESQVYLDPESPVIDRAKSVDLSRGIYGIQRVSGADIGPVEYPAAGGLSLPDPPSGLQVE